MTPATTTSTSNTVRQKDNSFSYQEPGLDIRLEIGVDDSTGNPTLKNLSFSYDKNLIDHLSYLRALRHPAPSTPREPKIKLDKDDVQITFETTPHGRVIRISPTGFYDQSSSGHLQTLPKSLKPWRFDIYLPGSSAAGRIRFHIPAIHSRAPRHILRRALRRCSAAPKNIRTGTWASINTDTTR